MQVRVRLHHEPPRQDFGPGKRVAVGKHWPVGILGRCSILCCMSISHVDTEVSQDRDQGQSLTGQ